MAALMVLFSLNAHAYDVEIDGIYYNLNEESNTAEVTSGDDLYTGEVVIPSSIETGGVTYSVTIIGSQAFYQCSDLTSVSIPNSVTSIDFLAFWGCTALASVDFPNSITFIDESAFNKTAWLNNQEDGVVYIGSMAYKYKGQMPENTSIIIKDGTTIINYDAFHGCQGLTSVTIPNSVTFIRQSAFQNCSNLTSVSVPNSVTKIEIEAFDGTPWYDNQEDGVIYIGSTVYKYKGVMPENTSIAIKDGITSISERAFAGCSGLTSVNIPSSVTNIGFSAFSGCI